MPHLVENIFLEKKKVKNLKFYSLETFTYSNEEEFVIGDKLKLFNGFRLMRYDSNIIFSAEISCHILHGII